MKRKCVILLAAVGVLVFSACSKNEDQDIRESLKEENLNIQNDAFYFSDLINLIGQNESGISDIPDMTKRDNDSYSALLFGQDVTIKIKSDKSVISDISISFENTEKKLLENAISEQMGTDAEEKGNCMYWETDDIVVEFNDSDQESIVTIKEN